MKTAKPMTFILSLALSFMAELAFAQAATVFSMTGTAQAIPNVGAPRTLRMGDSVNQGDTVATGAGESSTVLLFADGHVVMLVADSRLNITKYSYDRSDASKGVVDLNLVEGGMQAATGAIGKANPVAVKYQAGDTNITVQGTVVNVAVKSQVTSVVVVNGKIVFSFGSRSVTIEPNQGAMKDANGNVVSRSAAEIYNALGNTPQGLILKAVLDTGKKGEVERALNQAIRDAGGLDLNTKSTSTPTNTGTSGSSGSSGSGGGSASGR